MFCEGEAVLYRSEDGEPWDGRDQTVVFCEGETALCRSEEGEEQDSRDKTIVFQVAVSFLQVCAEGISRICLRSGHLLCCCCVGAFPVQCLP